MQFNSTKTYKQKKLFVTFRENEEESELYEWIIKEAKVGGVANYFKQLALKDKREKEGK